MNSRLRKMRLPVHLPYKCEYAKSGRSNCIGCNSKINVSSLRLGIKVEDTSHDLINWYHIDCFFKTICGPISANQFDGFFRIRSDDQTAITRHADDIQDVRPERGEKRGAGPSTEPYSHGSPSKKCKLEAEDVVDSVLERTEQNKLFYKLHDNLRAETKKTDWESILTANKQAKPVGATEMLYHLTDIIMFGAPEPCKECNDGKLIFDGNSAYSCDDYVSPWSKCPNKITNPNRVPVIIPDDIKKKYPFLAKEFKVHTRVLLNMPHEVPLMQSHVQRDIGKNIKKIQLKQGNVVDPQSGLEDTGHVYCDGNRKYSVYLTKVDIVLNKNEYYKIQLLESDAGDYDNKTYWVFRSWGGLRNIDCLSGYNVKTFNEGDDDEYRNITKLTKAIGYFESTFEDKTGNKFCDETFIKQPGKYHKIHIDDGDENIAKEILNTHLSTNCNLSPKHQDLIKLLFDTDLMKEVMLEFSLDVEKMPLGKLKKTQICEDKKVLERICELISAKDQSIQITEASNQFYSLIPHKVNAPHKQPPVIDDIKMTQEKAALLESLLKMDITYNYVQKSNNNADLLHSWYEQLGIDLTVLDHESEEFTRLEKFQKNTQSPLHCQYKLEVCDIFKVGQKNDALSSTEQFKTLPNHKLLWHGSRLTNFVSILSNGLKIAPPDAPVTGYMFGRGIYFADMVSKSANYCCTNRQYNTGLLLLCEVALGDSMNYHICPSGERVPSDKNSVKGVGKIYPNPEESQTYTSDDGVIVEIPLGQPIEDKNIKSCLEHNEYIVYDEAQVNIKYLCKIKFIYNAP